ncbi:MAG: TonB-dependent receptor [Gemmatimonadaceae bacterium]
MHARLFPTHSIVRSTVAAAYGLVSFLLPRSGLAQNGEGTAAVYGLVLNEARRPISSASIALSDSAGVILFSTSTNTDGRFIIERLPAGRPFQLTARALGFTPAIRDLTSLEPGRILQIEVGLIRTAGSLPTVFVVSEVPRDEAAGSGVAGDALRNLPLFNRSVEGLLQLIPQALGRGVPSFGSQNPRFNAVRIDGTTGNDVFGLGLMPGSQGAAPTLSLEALAGVRVAIAPMDVRSGGFTGATIDLETRSGSNHHTMSILTTLQQDELIGRYSGAPRAPSLDYRRVAVTAEGPIVRGKLHYLLTVDALRRDSAYQTGVSNIPDVPLAVVARARAAVIQRFGFDPGGAEAPIMHQPNHSAFVKLSWAASPRHALDVSYHAVRAQMDGFGRDGVDRGTGWMLSGSGYDGTARIDALRAASRVLMGQVRNETFASLSYSRELRDSRIRAPLFVVRYTPPTEAYLAAGSFRNAQGTVLDQHQAELGNDLTVTWRHHEVIFGGRLARFSFIDNLLLLRWGTWVFPNVDSLEYGSPTRYDIGLGSSVSGASPEVRFAAHVAAAYIQDRWTLTSRVQLTAGLRVEKMSSDAPATNSALLAPSSPLNLDTGQLPAAVRVLPRLGITVALDAAGRTRLRLGAGRFAAMPPYVWISNAFLSNGLTQRTLTCVPATGVPAPVADPSAAPTTCLRPSAYVNSTPIVAMAPGTDFPAEDRLVAAVDRGFGHGWTMTVDATAGMARSALTVIDRNLTRTGTDAEGRALYGTFNGAAALTQRVDPRVPPVIVYENYRNGDRSFTASMQLSRRWSADKFVQLGYSTSHASERMTPSGRSGVASLQNTPIDGSAESRRRTPSTYDVPHSFTALFATPVRHWFSASITFRAQSGRPFSYTVRGDANADSVNANDLAWIPRDSTDILLANAASWDTLNAFIAGEPCLARQRGHLAARNSCRNPSFATADLRLSRAWQSPVGAFELSADVFNLLNFIDHSRGLLREVTSREIAPLIDLQSWSATSRRPIYALRRGLPAPQVISDLSRWKVQLGLRYRP